MSRTEKLDASLYCKNIYCMVGFLLRTAYANWFKYDPHMFLWIFLSQLCTGDMTKMDGNANSCWFGYTDMKKKVPRSCCSFLYVASVSWQVLSFPVRVPSWCCFSICTWGHAIVAVVQNIEKKLVYVKRYWVVGETWSCFGFHLDICRYFCLTSCYFNMLMYVTIDLE